METDIGQSETHPKSLKSRTSVFTGMYSETDGLRLASEVFLLRRIEKDRIIREQLEAKDELRFIRDN